MFADKNVKHMEIVFENCESILLPIERISNLFINGMKQYLIHQSYSEFNLQNNIRHQCEHIYLHITYNDESELDYNSIDYDEPLGMFINNPTSNKVNDRPNILGRVMNYSDIVAIELLDENEDTLIHVYVPFKGRERNELMNVTTEGNKNKRVVVEIGERGDK